MKKLPRRLLRRRSRCRRGASASRQLSRGSATVTNGCTRRFRRRCRRATESGTDQVFSLELFRVRAGGARFMELPVSVNTLGALVTTGLGVFGLFFPAGAASFVGVIPDGERGI